MRAEEQIGAGLNTWRAIEHYTLKEIATCQNKTFKTKTTDYILTLHPQPKTVPLIERLGAIFIAIVQDITRDMADTDIVHFVLQSCSLNYPISLPYMPYHELTSERIMTEVQRVMQLNEMVYFAMPKVGVSVHKHKHDGFKLSIFLNAKQSTIQIKNKDNLILAKALVSEMACQEQHPQWNSICIGCQVQTNLAEQLHQQADVPEGLCGIPQLAFFKSVILNYQIVILSAEHFNVIFYKGPNKDKQSYLYHHQNHYDIIKSIMTFLGRNYRCLECKKGYNNKQDHHCSKVSKCCFAEGCKGVKTNAPWRECATCHRMFQGEECYANHFHPNKRGRSNCQP